METQPEFGLFFVSKHFLMTLKDINFVNISRKNKRGLSNNVTLYEDKIGNLIKSRDLPFRQMSSFEYIGYGTDRKCGNGFFTCGI